MIKKTLAILLALTLLAPTVATAAYPCGVYHTFTNEVLTASLLNNSFTQAVVTNMLTTCIQSLSGSVAAMRTTVDPYPSAAESLATDLAGEVQRIRYSIQDIKNQGFDSANATQWYIPTGRLTNKSGGSLAANDVIYINSGTASSVTTTTTAALSGFIGVAREAISSDATGRVAFHGIHTVATTGVVAIGGFLQTSTSAKLAKDSGIAIGAQPPQGSFAVALTSSAGGTATVIAYIFGLTPPLEKGTWTDASGSRVCNTAYQNTSGRTRRVMGSIYGINLGKLDIISLVGLSNPPNVTVGGFQVDVAATATQHTGTFAMIVPNNHYYKLTCNATGAMASWSELDE